MSAIFYFMQAWIIGVAIAAPVGPIGMLCIKKTLQLGLRGAFMVGFGAALADAAYGLIAALGLSAISNAILGKADLLRLLGGVFLLCLAYKEAASPSSNAEAHMKGSSAIKTVAGVFFLTITNPMTIMSFIGVFTSISGGIVSVQNSIIMVFGIFMGSMSWWFVLGLIITRVKHKLSHKSLLIIKYISCSILTGFGLYAIIASYIAYCHYY